MMETVPPRMLEGIKIVDLSTVVFGPYCTQTLAELGADVIKVEPPTGDIFRYVMKPNKTMGMGPGYLSLNRGKRSIVLDLKTEADAAVMRRLLASADIFIHNIRATAIDHLGLGYEAVKALRPDIIYIHCVGFGSDGPYHDLQAYDDVIQAATGTASLTSYVDGNPRPRYIPSLIADKVAGLHAAYAVLAAYIHRLRTQEGQFVEVPMFEAFTHFMLQEHLAGQSFDPPNGPIGYARQIDPNRQPFPTADGYISIVPYTEASIAKVFEVLGAPETLKEQRFSTPLLRIANVSELYAAIATLTPKFTTTALLEACHNAAIPAMAVRDIADIRGDPHLRAVNFFELHEHPSEGDIFEMKAPVKFGALPVHGTPPAPQLNEQGEAIRSALMQSADASHWPERGK